MSTMKRKSVSIFCILALVVSLLGMVPVDKSYGSTAFTKIALDGTCQTGYVDDGAAYYYFDVPSNGTVRVGVSNCGCSSISMVIARNSSFSSSSTIYSGKDNTMLLPEGTYYVEVDCTADHGTTESFEISANFKAFTDMDAEPNDSKDTAITMASGTTYKGHVYSSFGDVDWYKLKLTTKSVVHWYLDSASQAKGYLYNEAGDLVSFIQGCASGYTQPMYGLEAGTYYVCIVPSYGVDRNYSFSASVVERPTVNKITSVKATGIGKAKITWTKSKYAEGYYLYKEVVATGSWYYEATIPAGTLYYIDNSAPTPGGSIIYHVCGYRIDPVDNYHQDILSEDTNVGYKYNGAVPTPTSVKATKNTSSIKVSWSAKSGVTGYKIYRKANGGSYKLIKTVTGATTKSYTDKSVKKGTNYSYKVKAYFKDYTGKIYKSSYSSAVTAKLIGTIAKPTNVKAKKYSSYNKVTWNKVSTATGYKVYRKVGSGSYTLVKTTTAATFKDKSVKSGKKYTYKVKAYYNNYTYNSSKRQYTYTTKYSNPSKVASVKR